MRLIDADALEEKIDEIPKGASCYATVAEARAVLDFAVRVKALMYQAPTVTPEPGWIPFMKRPLTEDEQKNHPEWCYILYGDVPEDEQEILIYRPWRNAEGYIIEMDRYCNNGDECYLEGAGDIENGMYWMSLPKPPKEG